MHNYGSTATHTDDPTPQSLVNDGLKINSRLLEISQRISKLGDTLHGPEPRDANAANKAPEPMPSVRRNLSMMEDLVSSIEGELARIEGRL